MTPALDDLSHVLSALCPMHVVVDATGHIRRTGPTLASLHPGRALIGRRFLEIFELRRPRAVSRMADLVEVAGQKLHLSFRDPPHTTLKGLLVRLPNGGAVINLSFGISVLDAVGDYALSSADFAATDLAVEMLYLVEANSAAMEASRKLNLRLQGAMIAAEERSFTDTLTGLKNRRAMDHVLERLSAGAVPHALMLLDLDFFKEVNDRLGHAAGDHVLQETARAMREVTRSEDLAVRVGGDEFLLIFPKLDDRDTLGGIAARLIGHLEQPIAFGGDTCKVSASIGIALSSPGADDPADVLDAADAALYEAKRSGRAQYRFADAAESGSLQTPAATLRAT